MLGEFGEVGRVDRVQMLVLEDCAPEERYEAFQGGQVLEEERYLLLKVGEDEVVGDMFGELQLHVCAGQRAVAEVKQEGLAARGYPQQIRYVLVRERHYILHPPLPPHTHLHSENELALEVFEGVSACCLEELADDLKA